MAYLNDASKKTCSTCEYWQGSRSVRRMGNNPSNTRVEHDGRSAPCEARSIGPRPGNTNASPCSFYKRWVHLP